MMKKNRKISFSFLNIFSPFTYMYTKRYEYTYNKYIQLFVELFHSFAICYLYIYVHSYCIHFYEFKLHLLCTYGTSNLPFHYFPTFWWFLFVFYLYNTHGISQWANFVFDIFSIFIFVAESIENPKTFFISNISQKKIKQKIRVLNWTWIFTMRFWISYDLCWLHSLNFTWIFFLSYYLLRYLFRNENEW